jgi:hypothetical protein
MSSTDARVAACLSIISGFWHMRIVRQTQSTVATVRKTNTPAHPHGFLEKAD